MPEQIDLTQPDGAEPGTPMYRVSALVINVDTGSLVIDVVGANGKHRSFVYTNVGPTIAALNTANLSVKSLQRRILEKLIADGKLSGAISGTP